MKAAARILTMGPKYLVVKKGEHGALLFGAGRVFFAPALPLEDVIDPTGAGDTFAGGFIAWLLLLLSFAFAGGAIVLALRPGAPEVEPAAPTGPPL